MTNGKNNTGIIVKRFSYVDELWAFKKGVSGLALLLLNFVIHNSIAGRERGLRSYDNDKYEMPIYALAKAWNVSRLSLQAAKNRLQKTGLILVKVNAGINYMGVDFSILPNMMIGAQKRFIRQCKNWKRLDIFEMPIIRDRMKPLIDMPILDARKDVPLADGGLGHTKWADDLALEICQLAERENITLERNGKFVKIFSHLKNGEFKKSRRGINRVCGYFDQMASGLFLRQAGSTDLAGAIRESYRHDKQFDMAKRRFAYISQTLKSRKSLRAFILRCVRNYFVACKEGEDTYRDVKKGYPITLEGFFLHKGNGLPVANFLFFYVKTLSADNQLINDRAAAIGKVLGDRLTGKIEEYEMELGDSETKAKSFYINLGRLVKYTQGLIESNKTSYSIYSCFDMMFEKVDAQKKKWNTINPGYFLPTSQTIQSVMREIINK